MRPSAREKTSPSRQGRGNPSREGGTREGGASLTGPLKRTREGCARKGQVLSDLTYRRQPVPLYLSIWEGGTREGVALKRTREGCYLSTSSEYATFAL